MTRKRSRFLDQVETRGKIEKIADNIKIEKEDDSIKGSSEIVWTFVHK